MQSGQKMFINVVKQVQESQEKSQQIRVDQDLLVAQPETRPDLQGETWRGHQHQKGDETRYPRVKITRTSRH